MANTLDKIKLSGVTYDIIDSTAIHSMDGYWTSGQTESAITAATAALAETVGQELSGKVDNDTYTAYTAATDAALSGKASASDVETLSGTVTGMNSTLTAHTADTTIHVTAADKESWNAKIASGDVASLFGNVNYDSNTKRINFYHDSTSGTVLAYVDASDFIKDGMVDNVEIKDVEISGETVTCLVITFNTDAGKEEIDIPISDIFDASNYYTKSEVDDAISAATSGKVETSTYTAYTAATEAVLSGKADTTAVTQAISEAVSGKADSSDVETLSGTVTGMNATLTAHTADTTIHVTSTDKTTWSGKQDALVSGTNIKTINGNSILGSGNIDVQSLPTVSGTTLVFS